MTSEAPLSPKSRGVPALGEFISRLERYERWAQAEPTALPKIVGKDAYSSYLSMIDQIASQMKEARKLARVLEVKILDTFAS